MTKNFQPPNYIPLKIKELREKSGWSQSRLAQESGVTASAISMIENGQRAPSFVVIRKLSDALKVSVSELTGETTQEEASQHAQAFFREFGTLGDLSKEDREIILKLAESLKAKDNGHSKN